MAAEIIQLRPKQPLLAGYLRVGHNGQKRLQGMLAAGKLQHSRFVMDASHLHEQTELLSSFRKAEREVILDTNFAEMFFEGRFKSAIKSLPWANQDRPWTSDDFRASRNFDVAHAIAEFAIKHGVNAILSPSHFVSLADAGSVSNDYVLCESLRKELDRLGGKDIKLDFELSLTPKALHDYSVRQALAAVFRGAVGKDVVSRVWRKIKGDWDAWNTRSLADEPIVRLILDGTAVRVRLDRQATAPGHRVACVDREVEQRAFELMLVGQRRRMLRYYEGKDLDGYRQLIKDLGLRR